VPTSATAAEQIPDRVLALAAGRELRPMWCNWRGGLTYEVVGAQQFIKWASHPDLDLLAEAARLRWAAEFSPVPKVLSTRHDGQEQWLVTTAVRGQSAVSKRWRARPAAATKAIGKGLRRLHDSLPAERCPFSWSVETRLAGVDDDALYSSPPIDRLVVCHGDACAPNAIIDDDGEFSGYVDADPWVWQTDGPTWRSRH
jgi:kanamycin kinase